VAVLSFEGIVENGQIRLHDPVTLPEHTKAMSSFLMWRSRPKRTSTAHVWPIQNKLPTLPSRSSRYRLMPSYDVSDFNPPAPAVRRKSP
jgi:hypothetical protein